MKRQDLISKANIQERTLRSLLVNLTIDPESQDIPDDVANQIIAQLGNQSQPQKQQTKSHQLNQSAPASSLEELQQVNAQNMVLAEELQKSVAIAEIQRMTQEGAHVGALAVTAYQQALLGQVAIGLGEWARLANERTNKITSISLATIFATNQNEALNLIAENSAIQSTKFLPIFAQSTSQNTQRD